MQVSLFDKNLSDNEEVVVSYNPVHKDEFEGDFLVENLDLDKKTINFLNKADIFKIKDLKNRDLSEIRGIGVNSLDRIKKIINQIYSEINIPYKKTSFEEKKILYIDENKRITLSLDNLKVSGEVLLDDLDLDKKIVNYLKKGGYIKIKDLIDKNLTKVRGIRESSIDEVKKSINLFIKRINDQTFNKSFDLRKFMEDVLDERELDIVCDRLGLLGEETTLEKKAKSINVTRERIRQIQAKAINKLKKKTYNYFNGNDFFNYIFESAKNNLNINDLVGLPSAYNPKGVVKLLSLIFPNKICLYKNKLITMDLITHPDNVKKLDNLIKNINEVLLKQINFVDIDEIVNYFKCDKKYIEKQKKAVVNNGLIAIKSNKKAFGKDKYYIVEQLLINNPRPVHISEIMEKASMSDREVRSLIERMKKSSGVVNVGPSLYSLKDFGYKNLDTKQLIIDLLKEAGEPMSIKNLIKSIQNRRVVKKNTILVTLSDKKNFQRPIKGYVALLDYSSK